MAFQRNPSGGGAVRPGYLVFVPVTVIV